MRPLFWVLLGENTGYVWNLEASSALLPPGSLAFGPFTSESQLPTPRSGSRSRGWKVEAAPQESWESVAGAGPFCYLSPHTSPYPMSVATQATPSEDPGEGVAALSSVQWSGGPLRQDRAREAELGKEWLCKVPKLLRPRLVPGKLAPNDRLEPQDRGRAACPRPPWARRLGGEKGGLSELWGWVLSRAGRQGSW